MQDGEIFVLCDQLDNLPVIKLLIGEYWFEMLPIDYFISTGDYC